MRVVILGSGRGSNAEAVLRAQQAGQLGTAKVVHIFSDKPEAGILSLGPRFGVPASFVDPSPFKTKLDGDGEARFIAALQACDPDLVVLAGFMRVLKRRFLDAFANRIINLHPSLLPAFPGLDGIGQAFRAGVSETGCTVHYVSAEVDGGEIIEQKRVPITPADTLETLASKVHEAEHQLLPAVIARLSKAARNDSVYEFRAELAVAAVAAVEEWLVEREEQQLMVFEDKTSAQAWLVGYFASRGEAEHRWIEVSAALDQAWIIGECRVVELPNKNWKESYKEHFKAWKFGRLHWVPVWEKNQFILPHGEEVLWLDPGMAFGTGNHETTRLVIERMVEIAQSTDQLGDVIDAGCGSGILALSAAKLGFRSIAAFDNDSLAVDVARQNAVLNGLTGRVDFYVGDLVSGLAGRRASLVLANIQADVLAAHVHELLAAVAPGGTLVLSGILATEVGRVKDVFHRAAPAWPMDSRTSGEWCDLVCTAI